VKSAVMDSTKKSNGEFEGNFSDRVLFCYVSEFDVRPTPTSRSPESHALLPAALTVTHSARPLRLKPVAIPNRWLNVHSRLRLHEATVYVCVWAAAKFQLRGPSYAPDVRTARLSLPSVSHFDQVKASEGMRWTGCV
jgi:hypothetical protein